MSDRNQILLVESDPKWQERFRNEISSGREVFEIIVIGTFMEGIRYIRENMHKLFAVISDGNFCPPYLVKPDDYIDGSDIAILAKEWGIPAVILISSYAPVEARGRLEKIGVILINKGIFEKGQLLNGISSFM